MRKNQRSTNELHLPPPQPHAPPPPHRRRRTTRRRRRTTRRPEHQRRRRQREEHHDRQRQGVQPRARRPRRRGKAKLEAKYAGYDEYKAKAAKYDANESGNAAKLEAADKKIEALTKEITTLKATAERETLIGQLAKDTGLGRDVISRLKGDGDELKANAKALKDSLRPNIGLPTPPASKTATSTTGNMTPLQLLSQAYAAK